MSGIDYTLTGYPDDRSSWVQPCIYEIRNLSTGDCYIGSAWRPWERWRRHLSMLRRGVHHSVILQRAFCKYSVGHFAFRLLRSFLPDEVPRDVLFRLEQEYIAHLRPVYNVAREVGRLPEVNVEARACLTRLVSKDWKVTDPQGTESTIHNLAAFCRERGLVKTCMQHVAAGRMSQHRGWKCRYATDAGPRYVQKGRPWVGDKAAPRIAPHS